MTDGGFPHSDIHGSRLACSSPWLFAAYRVLHRLLVPRHPPYALFSMTNLFSSTGMDDHYTGIALPALVLGSFFYFVFSKVL